MSANNTMHVIGNLGDDPALRFTTTGKPVCRFRIGINDRVQIDGEWQTRTEWMNVVCWDDLAENVAQSLVKGNRVQVTGRHKTRVYEPEAGNKQYFVELVADEVGVALRWQTVDSIEKTKGAATTEQADRREPAMAGGGDAPVYGDEEPF